MSDRAHKGIGWHREKRDPERDRRYREFAARLVNLDRKDR